MSNRERNEFERLQAKGKRRNAKDQRRYNVLFDLYEDEQEQRELQASLRRR